MKKRIGLIAVAAVWAALAVWAWLRPAQDLSLSERRPLARKPTLRWETLLDGSFMADFEDASLDQFPLRDSFRRVKSLVHFYALNQSDKDGIYVSDGVAAAQEYPLSETSVNHALDRFNRVYEQYLRGTDSRIFCAVVPDKGYYLAEETGHLSMDYGHLFSLVAEGIPWAEQIDLTDTLSAEDYYRTDTHWRQEKITDVAAHIAGAMGVSLSAEYTEETLDAPFYGVHCRQADIDIDPDTLIYLTNDILSECKVYDGETDAYTDIYNMELAAGDDPYEIFLSGAKSLLTVENPAAQSGKELIIFRDSFASSLAPLLAEGYSKITLVDIRYLAPQLLGRFLDFHGQDILFIYSAPVLNNSATIK